MKAGRELDALVAEHVIRRAVTRNARGFDGKRGCGWHNDLGFTDTRFPRVDWRHHMRSVPWGASIPEELHHYTRVPPYSADIASAWEVVDKLEADGWQWCIVVSDGVVYADLQHSDPDSPDFRTVGGEADTAPLAICIAALRAVGVEVPDEA